MNGINEHPLDVNPEHYNRFESEIAQQGKIGRELNADFKTSLIQKKPLSNNFSAADYLQMVEPHISKGLISSENYAEIKTLAKYFLGKLTSFFGFETKLDSPQAHSDYMFAISSKNGEREALADLITNRKFPDEFYMQPEWQQVADFTKSWCDSQSELYDNVLGMWFEFDTENGIPDVPVPCVFIHTKPIKKSSPGDAVQYNWLTRTALPLLIGQPLSKKLENQLFDCIQKMPQNASIYEIGSMLSRATYGLRLEINRLHINQIIPYLESIGWSDENGELSLFLEELEKYITRIVLAIHIDGDVNPKVGIECSFHPKSKNQKEKWVKFLSYLTKKGLCVPEKRESLVRFTGIETDGSVEEYCPGELIPSIKIPDNDYSCALVRFISHIKIVYQPGHPLEAKGYFGVRECGIPKNGGNYRV